MQHHNRFEVLWLANLPNLPLKNGNLLPNKQINLIFCHLFLHSTRQAKSAVSGGVDQEVEPVSILHPQAAKAEGIIRNAWADARLVAD